MLSCIASTWLLLTLLLVTACVAGRFLFFALYFAVSLLSDLPSPHTA